MGMQKRQRKGEQVILILRLERYTAVLQIGQIAYLFLMLLLGLQTQEGRWSYIDRASKITLVESGVLHRATLLSGAKCRDPLHADAIYTTSITTDIAIPRPRTAVTAPTIFAPRTKNAVAVYLRDDAVILLLWSPQLMHMTTMNSQKPGYLSIQTEQKSSGQAHGDWNTNNKVNLRTRKLLEIQRDRTDKWERTMMHPYAEDKVTTVEVGMEHITEVHSHHHRNHTVECNEWSFWRTCSYDIEGRGSNVCLLQTFECGGHDLSLYDEIILRRTPSVCLCFGKESLVIVDSACFFTKTQNAKMECTYQI
jgi:hypothetical protein